MWRLLLLLVVMAGLAPGTWLRSPGAPPDNRQLLTITPIAPGTSHLGRFA